MVFALILNSSSQVSMQILHSRLDCPHVSTDDCGSSLSPFPSVPPRAKSSTARSVVALLREIVFGEPSSSLRTQVGHSNDNCFVTCRVELHSLDEEMDDKFVERFVENPNPNNGMRQRDVEPSSSGAHRSGRADPAVGAQGGDRKNPDDDKHPGDHYNENNGGSSQNDKGNENDEDNNDDDDDDDEDEERRLSSPYSSKHRDGEILRRKNKAVLIVNLYPPKRGYTYCCYVRELEGDDPNEIQVFKESHEIPYSETYILDCIDQEIVPLRLIQKLEKVDGVNLMRYLGCVVCEIRDYRRFSSNLSKRNAPVVKKVLLKPTNYTLFSELNQLIAASIEDRKLYKELNLEYESTLPKPGQDQDGISEHPISETDFETDEPASKRLKTSDNSEIEACSEVAEPDERNFDKLSLKQRLEVEKQLLLRTYSGLCLDPSKSVGLIANVRQFERFKWNSPHVKDAIRSHSSRAKSLPQSQKVQNKIPPTDETDTHKEWETMFGKIHKEEDLAQFFEFTKRSKSKKLPEGAPAERTRPILRPENPLEALKLPPINFIEYTEMASPTNLEVLSLIGRPAERAVHRPIMSENYIRKVDEYVLETERRKRPHSTKLSIFQRNGTESYFGELEQESFAEPSQNNSTVPNPSTKCQFELGSLRHVQLYVRQFTDIFTEDGRRPCKITYQKVGQPNPHVMFIGDYVNHTQPQNRTPAITNSSNPVNNNSVNTNNNNNNTAGFKPNFVKSTTASPVQTCAPPLSHAGTTPPTISAVSTPVVNSSASPTSTSQPPVQIVHPQPRSIQQAQITAPQIHYSVAPQTAAIMQPPQSTIQATGTNVNVNLNLNSTRVVHQQPLLTRPQIINVNLQQSSASIVSTTNTTNYTAPKIQTSAQQQPQAQIRPPVSPMTNNNNSLRLKQPTLATLLMAPNPKPITVIQPQPQNPNMSQAIQLGNSSTANQNHQKQHQNLQNQLSQIVQQQQSQQLVHSQQQTSQQQPIMIITNTAGTHQQHNGSVSLNLNTISLDSLLSAGQQQQQYVTTASLISPGGSNNPTLNGMNHTILRFSNHNNTLTLTPQQQQLLRQGALSLNMNSANSAGTILNQGIIINSAPNSMNQHPHVMNNSSLAGHRGGNTATISASIGPTQQPKCNDRGQRQLEEINVPDLHSLLNSAPSTSSATFRNQTSGPRAIDGLNLDLNLNLNLNLGGAPTASPMQNSSLVSQSQGQIIYDPGNNSTHHHHDGVDSLFNALSEVIGPELGQKLDGAMRQGGTGNTNANVVTSSLSPTKSVQNTNNNSITLNDLLGSPPIMVSSTNQQTNGVATMQSPQSPSITSILSPISPNISTNAVPYSTTPRLSALLAGTPSADSSGMSVSNRFDPSTARGPNSTTSNSYGNLLDRLVASSGQQQSPQRAGGSRLNPIASATPMLASSLGGAPLNARQGTGGPGTVGLARPTAYRQIAPAPPPNRHPQPQQLINVIGYVGNSPTPGSTPQGQPTIRVVNNSSQGSGGNLGSRLI